MKNSVKLKSGFFYLTLVLLTVVNSVTPRTSFGIEGKQKGVLLRGSTNRNRSRLGGFAQFRSSPLSLGQRERLRLIEDSRPPHLGRLIKERRQLKSALQKILSKHQGSESQAAFLLKQIEAKEREINGYRLQKQFAVKRVLTEDQYRTMHRQPKKRRAILPF